ncbi:hypothetical protein MGSAQ_002183 [marine sediment metagenome]|uniref:Uncharacterized protein n=1 Tax=marine sediment metagenome TaxID=412755 RepID=A0A1B6NTS6_9ZZZZ
MYFIITILTSDPTVNLVGSNLKNFHHIVVRCLYSAPITNRICMVGTP